MIRISRLPCIFGRAVPAALLFAVAACGPARIGGPAPPPRAPDPRTAAPRTADAGVEDSSPAALPEIAILFDGAISDYSAVAARLSERLPPDRYRVTPIPMGPREGSQLPEALRGRPRLYVVAIGLEAARMARDGLDAPIVFAQVFNYQELLVEGRPIRGVSALPPFALQAREWKRLDPELRRLGVIVSERHAHLVGEAAEGAAGAGLVLEHLTSTSDQETLYLFRRLAPLIDGLWLIPDEGILSPPVVRDLLGYAVAHGVRVLVSSDVFLEWGASLSATSTASDVADAVRTVLERMIAGEVDALPAMTPLSEVTVRVNPQVADRLGLAPLPGESRTVGSGP